MRKLGISLILCSLSLLVYAQNKGTIKGILQDSSSKQILSFATVTVFEAKDTSLITYRLSDPTGKFQVPGIPLNIQCRMVITAQGYHTFRKEFILTKEQSQLDLEIIRMAIQPLQLEDVTVIAERPPVVMRNDTLEFNAAAFKSLPSALVEDLLKKLPGVDVDLDGNITVKGKKVNRLLVDGKEFFGGDHKLATRNLPANIVDKVQVTDDKEELESNPQMTRDEVGQVLNIKLKKAIRQGWFGKAYAGYGTNDRHETGAIVNIFKDTAQLSLLGYSNNVNKPSFDARDIQQIGGFNRSGINTMSASSDGSFSINGNSFGGGGAGIQESKGGGFNYNNIFAKKFTVNLQYFFGQVRTDFQQFSNTQKFFDDTVITNIGSNLRNSLNRNHRIAGSMIWKKDTLTTVTFRPGLSLSNNRTLMDYESVLDDNYKGRIISNSGQNNSTIKSYNFSESLSASHRYRNKKGRFLNVTSNFSVGNDHNNTFNDYLYTFYTNSVADDSVVNQLKKNENKNLRADANFNFTEPLNKSLTLILTNQVNYLQEDNIQGYYYKDYGTGKYDVFNSLYSNGIERAGWRNTLSGTVSIKLKKWVFRPGINLYVARLNNTYTKNPQVEQDGIYVYPSLSVNWNSFNFNYRANISEPSAYDLQQVIDISNPLFQSYGNPNLQPAYNHNLNAGYYKYSPKGNSLNVNVNMSFTTNSILRETLLDSRRVQETRSFNIDGTRSVFVNAFYNRQYKFNKKFRMSLAPGLNGNYRKSFVSFNGKLSSVENTSVYGSFRASFNYKDIIEVNQRYAVNNSKARYEDHSRYKNVDFTSQSSESELVVRWPKHFVWENLVNYAYNPRVGKGIKKSTVRWNAGLSYLFLKEDKGQLKFAVVDLLDQNVNISHYTYENNIMDTQAVTLHRYFMLSFIYNIRTFSGGKVGGKDRTFGFF
jgi:hypothetical protein